MRWLLVLSLMLPTPALAGVLDDVRREVRGEDHDDDPPARNTGSHESRRDSSDSTDRYDDDCDANEGVDAEAAIWSVYLMVGLARGVAYVVSAPVWMPLRTLEPGPRREFRYEDYPFASGRRGALRVRPPYQRRSRPYAANAEVDPQWVEEAAWNDEGQSWAAQLSVEGGYLPYGAIARGAIGARLLTPTRLELSARVTGLMEPTKGDVRDTLQLGAAGLAYRFAQSERLQFRLQLDTRWLHDSEGTSFGGAAAYGIEGFVAPFVLDATFAVGWLGHAMLIEARASAGVMLGSVEIYAGYQHAQVGSVPLGGPLAGLRVWF